MNGKRVDNLEGYHQLAEGEYTKLDGIWYARPPGYEGVANLSRHTITENADGTITVSPSIMIDRGRIDEWHGFLEAGVWRLA